MSGRVLSDWRLVRKVGEFAECLFLPLWERVAELIETDEGLSPRRDPQRVHPRTFSHKGRKRYPRFGQAAATASASQLAISSVPPVGAAIGNSPCPA